MSNEAMMVLIPA